MQMSGMVTIDRRRVYACICFLLAYSMLLPLSGCVPAVIVEWGIAAHPLSPSEDLDKLRGLIAQLGYEKLESPSRTSALPNAEFFTFSKSQHLSLTLIWDANGAIRVKFIESGEKKLSASGNEQVTLIAANLEKVIGESRITLTQGP